MCGLLPSSASMVLPRVKVCVKQRPFIRYDLYKYMTFPSHYPLDFTAI